MTKPARGSSYDAHKEGARHRQSVQSQAGRDIGGIPNIADVARREACRGSLRLFCETYNHEAFYHGWSPDHLKAIARIEESVFHGALFAFAMPRGSGKTTICRMAALWAVAYAHCRYVYVIGANAGKAQDTLDAIKTFARFLPEFAADFPEISAPVQALGGVANRASGQICNGESTMIAWGKDRVVLPTVPQPDNITPDCTSGSIAGQAAPTSGSIIGVSGLTGDGIRGSLHTLMTGEQLRPDFVLLDDPQTDESAGSNSQNETRERLVAGAVLGMAGPGEEISAVMPCTVIRKGDFIDRILDRKSHPLWRGERTKMLTTMPEDMDAWGAYFDVYRRGAQLEPPDHTEANAYYEAHREAMDAGAEASWPERKLKGEVSPIQHAMNLYCRDPAAFWAEYQNEPLEMLTDDREMPTVEQIEAKTHGLERGIVPMDCTTLTAFIDVQQKLLWWCVCAWKDEFTGYIVDYGSFPDQQRDYFTLRDANKTLAEVYPSAGLEGSIYAGLDSLSSQIIAKEWQREDGVGLKVDRCLIDAGWGQSTDTVYQLCRQSKFSSILRPSKGEAVTASKVPMTDYPKTRGRIGHHWYEPRDSQAKRAVRLIIYDTNHWKSFVFARLSVSMGDPGCLSLFEPGRSRHRMFAEQVTAETPVRTEGRGRTVDEWKQRAEHADNHYLDCLVGCAVAASMQGVRMVDHNFKTQVKRERIKLSDLQKGRR